MVAAEHSARFAQPMRSPKTYTYEVAGFVATGSREARSRDDGTLNVPAETARPRLRTSYFTATVTGALSKPATVSTNGTASPGVMPLGT